MELLVIFYWYEVLFHDLESQRRPEPPGYERSPQIKTGNLIIQCLLYDFVHNQFTYTRVLM